MIVEAIYFSAATVLLAIVYKAIVVNDGRKANVLKSVRSSAYTAHIMVKELLFFYAIT